MSESLTLPPGSGAVPAVLRELSFDEYGLVAAVAQQHDTGEVLMLAWMNREAVEATLRTGRVHYWSRSRQKLWRKGEQSGQVQRLVELRVDCDGDALLLLVDQHGVACHTGRRSCFFRAVRGDALVTIAPPLVTPGELYGEGGS
ncbi:MAG TPA: phosphoribosyl-AMP cyclohydrolase [Stellaceae bacterium]